MTATALEASFGLGQSLIWMAAPEYAVQLLGKDPALRAWVDGHLRRAKARALAILTANRLLVIEMAQALERAGILMGVALNTLIARVTMEGAAPRPALDMSSRSLPGITAAAMASDPCESDLPGSTQIGPDKPEPHSV